MAHSGQKAILIIDDDAATRAVHRHLLNTAGGYIIYEAEDGKTGFALACDLRPDCILLQLKLKEQSGLEVLDQLVKEASTSTIPVIMVSTRITGVVMEGALSFGASHFLIQGDFDAAGLDAVIRHVIKKPTNL